MSRCYGSKISGYQQIENVSKKVKSHCCIYLKHVKALIQFYSIYQILAKCSAVESERTVSKFRKKKQSTLLCFRVSYYYR